MPEIRVRGAEKAARPTIRSLTRRRLGCAVSQVVAAMAAESKGSEESINLQAVIGFGGELKTRTRQ